MRNIGSFSSNKKSFKIEIKLRQNISWFTIIELSALLNIGTKKWDQILSFNNTKKIWEIDLGDLAEVVNFELRQIIIIQTKKYFDGT